MKDNGTLCRTDLSTAGSVPRAREGRRAAFTLIELLVVVAVISVLIALLIPGASLMRERARGATCLSRLRQIGSTLYAYAGDHQGAIPPTTFLGFQGQHPPAPELRAWHSRLIHKGYLDANSDVFFCPTFRPRAWEGVERENAPDPLTDLSWTYGMRLWTQPNRDFQEAHMYRQLSWISDPAEFFLVADSVNTNVQAQWASLDPREGHERIRLSHTTRGELDHSGVVNAANAVFADGSAGARPGSYFTGLAGRQTPYHGGNASHRFQTVTP